MKKILAFSFLSMCMMPLYAQPNIGQLLQLHESIVQISVELEHGNSGTGTGVVISPEYVVTNCHVLANGKGANVAKYGDGYKPIALKADWKHDLCALKFEGLPFKAVPMRDSASLINEEEVFSVGYPNGNNVPQPSYGSIKAKYPFDGSLIIRSDAAFALGSSGGALFDQQFNLIGITSFKSPGPQGFFYSLPVEWIKRLINSPDLLTLNTEDSPFWALPHEQQPYFMRVVLPYQNKEWETLNKLSLAWVAKEPNTADAWYFLAISQLGLSKANDAKLSFAKSLNKNPRHLEAMKALFDIALKEADTKKLAQLRADIEKVDVTALEELDIQIAALKEKSK